ncbi:TPA: hypothetical protein ACPY8A_000204 [Yersinia enterocolitica]
MNKHIEDLINNAMLSSLEGYAFLVADSIEFELNRKLTTTEHQQVFVAVEHVASGNSALLAKLEAAEKEINDWRSIAEASAQDDADWRKLADSKNELTSHLAQGIIQLKQRAEAAEVRLLVPWIKRSEQMPDPKDKRRVCVFTPNTAADLRYRLVPANLFKAVCSSATHWLYVNDPVEGGE